MGNTIEISKFSQFYGRKQVLYNINLQIGQGMFGLLGANGAGKTTLMRTLATLLPLRAGNIRICGVPVSDVGQIRRMIGYLPQDFSVYPSMTVREAMDYMGILSGMPGRRRQQRTEMLLEQVNLTAHANKKVKALSGGMRQRLGMAQALLHDPKVLIVDEPTAGLDPEERIRLRELLSDEARKRIVILSTHIVGDVEVSCEDIAVLGRGRLLYQGSIAGAIELTKGHVFEMNVSQRELEYLKQEHPVTNVRAEGRGIRVRFLSENLIPGAQPAEPGLEDAYVFCQHRAAIPRRSGAAGRKGAGDHAVSERM